MSRERGTKVGISCAQIRLTGKPNVINYTTRGFFDGSALWYLWLCRLAPSVDHAITYLPSSTWFNMPQFS